MVLVLKMVLACATVTEGNGQSEIGYRLFESVREAADRVLHSEAIEVKSLPFVVLVVGSGFSFELFRCLAYVFCLLLGVCLRNVCYECNAQNELRSKPA